MWWKWNMNNCSFCHIFCSFPRPYYLSFWIHTSQRQESLARKINVTTIQLPYYFPLTCILVSTDFLKIFLWFSNNFFITYIAISYNFITTYLGTSFLQISSNLHTISKWPPNFKSWDGRRWLWHWKLTQLQLWHSINEPARKENLLLWLHCNTGMHFIGKNTQEKGWSKRGCGVFSRAQERLPSPVLLYSVEGLYSLFKINENHVQSY